MSLKVSKSFVINADAVKAYDDAREFFLKRGYTEQSTIRPTLLVLKRREDPETNPPLNAEYCRANLRASFSPVGDMQLYSGSLLTVRCEYEVKCSGGATAASNKALFEAEVEKLRCCLMGQVFKEPSAQRISGVKKLEPAKLEAKLVAQTTDIRVGDDLNLAIQVANLGKDPVSVTKVESILPIDFRLVDMPENCSFENSQLVIERKPLGPAEKDEIQIKLKAFKTGTFELKPKIIFVDEIGNRIPYELETKILNVSTAPLPNRISTGYEELNSLLLGGIPEKYAVILTSPSCDERDLLIKRFLEAGAKSGQITFYITGDGGNGAALAEDYQPNFYLFVCNPRAEVMVKNLPNVFKLKGVECLTDIDIALVKAFRMLNASQSDPRRACVEITSDVLLQHRAVVTRKWLSALLPDLKSKGFTTLAVVNPHMHPQEEVQAILGLFEGEIRVSEKETDKGPEKILRIKRLYNQRYLENGLALTRERLEL